MANKRKVAGQRKAMNLEQFVIDLHRRHWLGMQRFDLSLEDLISRVRELDETFKIEVEVDFDRTEAEAVAAEMLAEIVTAHNRPMSG